MGTSGHLVKVQILIQQVCVGPKRLRFQGAPDDVVAAALVATALWGPGPKTQGGSGWTLDLCSGLFDSKVVPRY